MAQTKRQGGLAAPPDPTVIQINGTPPPGSRDNPLRKFSRELALRFPERVIKRFAMPKSVRQLDAERRECREVFILEITSRDEIEAAMMADAMMSPVERQSYKLTQEAERREAIRLSIVGVGKLVGDDIMYSHTNADGIPLGEINGWSIKAWAALQLYFGQLNGVPDTELAEGLLGAQTVGAFEPPTGETLASAERGR